jgi:hypothetical protein
LVESRDKALQLLPWHRALPAGAAPVDRLVARAGSRFRAVEALDDAQSVTAVIAELDRMSRQRERGFLAVEGSHAWRFRGPPSSAGGADFELLHAYLADEFGREPGNFGVFRSPRRALEAVGTAGSIWSGGVAFLLPHLDMNAIETQAFEGRGVMARKSTMFLPKVAEGVIFSSAGKSSSS